MKYFLDTEFIENGETIDLISIGIVADDGRTIYLQNANCKFKKASDFVWRNVFNHLIHFDMSGDRSCTKPSQSLDSKITEKCFAENCPWRSKYEIRDAVIEFCNQEKYGKPEFWGYYADYDWVAFCQLFGTMMHLPKGFPMYCRDIKQWADVLNARIPKPAKEVHHALVDAEWTRDAYLFLSDLEFNQPK